MVYLTPDIRAIIKESAVTCVRETCEGGGVPCLVTPELILLLQIPTFYTVKYIYCTGVLGGAPPLCFQ